MRFALVAGLSLGLLFGSLACGDDSSSGSGGGGATAASTSSSNAGGAGGATNGSGGSTTNGSGGAGGSTTNGSGGAGGGDPLAGYGAIAGACGEIDLEDLLSSSPELLQNSIDFTLRPNFDLSLLSPGGQEVVTDGNLGGSSLYSEAFAFEVLYRCDGASLLKTEGEIVYATMGKKTDLLVAIDGEKVGVSVVRAMSFPEGAAYPVSQAKSVLEGKLSDILQSSVNVAPEDSWGKQILAVVAQSELHAQAIADAYTMIEPAIVADTIVLVTVTDGSDQFIYYNN